ncbi:Hypothetical protein D9617_2g059210 [Elsinoe fawcettii]|nr:Hypothetical protein D9617_2g059210 [Elsinoe fawcettii]
MASSNTATSDFPFCITNWTNPSGSASLNSGSHSDCTIKVKGGKLYKLHLVIVTRTCPYFEKVFSGSFSEAQSRVLDWSEHDGYVVDATIKYIYGNVYSKVFPPAQMSDIKNHIKIYGFADSIQYTILKVNALKHIKSYAKIAMDAMTLKATLEAVNDVGPYDAELLTEASNWVGASLGALKILRADEKATYFNETPLLAQLLVESMRPPTTNSLAPKVFVCPNATCRRNLYYTNESQVAFCPYCGTSRERAGLSFPHASPLFGDPSNSSAITHTGTLLSGSGCPSAITPPSTLFASSLSSSAPSGSSRGRGWIGRGWFGRGPHGRGGRTGHT